MTPSQVVEQFKGWLAGQPPETVINHSTWHSCAMGDFIQAVEPIYTLGCEPIDAWHLSGLFRRVYGHHNYMTLGNGGTNAFSPVAVPMANFGELSAWLHSLEPVEPSV